MNRRRDGEGVRPEGVGYLPGRAGVAGAPIVPYTLEAGPSIGEDCFVGAPFLDAFVWLPLAEPLEDGKKNTCLKRDRTVDLAGRIISFLRFSPGRSRILGRGCQLYFSRGPLPPFPLHDSWIGVNGVLNHQTTAFIQTSSPRPANHVYGSLRIGNLFHLCSFRPALTPYVLHSIMLYALPMLSPPLQATAPGTRSRSILQRRS